MVEEIEAMVSRKDFLATKIAEVSFVDQDFREKTSTSSIIGRIIIWNNLNFLCALCVIFPLRALREKKTQVSRKERKDFHAKIAESSFVNQDFREKPSTSSIIEKIIIWFNLNFLSSLCVILPLQALREKNYRQLTNINLEYNE